MYQPRDFARLVSFVSQEGLGRGSYTVREVLKMGRYPYQGRFFNETHDEKQYGDLWQQTVTDYKLLPFLDRKIFSLSTGERQKVFVASSVIQDTKCIILDEPTSALDIKESCSLFKLLRLQVNNFRKLVICVTHDINGALVYSDKILASKNGRVYFFGVPDECCRLKVIHQIFDTTPLEVPHPYAPVQMVIPWTAGLEANTE